MPIRRDADVAAMAMASPRRPGRAAPDGRLAHRHQPPVSNRLPFLKVLDLLVIDISASSGRDGAHALRSSGQNAVPAR